MINLKEFFEQSLENNFVCQIITSDNFRKPQNFDDIDWEQVKGIHIYRPEI